MLDKWSGSSSIRSNFIKFVRRFFFFCNGKSDKVLHFWKTMEIIRYLFLIAHFGSEQTFLLVLPRNRRVKAVLPLIVQKCYRKNAERIAQYIQLIRRVFSGFSERSSLFRILRLIVSYMNQFGMKGMKLQQRRCNRLWALAITTALSVQSIGHILDLHIMSDISRNFATSYEPKCFRSDRQNRIKSDHRLHNISSL